MYPTYPTETPPRRHWLPPALAGLLAMLAVVGLQEALNGLNQAIPSAPSAAGQTIVDLTPGALTVKLIDWLGPWAMRLLIGSGYLGTALLGLLLGRIAGGLGTAGHLGWAAAVLAGVPFLLYLAVAPSQLRDPGALPLIVVAGLLFALLYAGLTLLLWSGLQPSLPAAGLAADRLASSQRRALLGGSLAALALLGGGFSLSQLVRRQVTPAQALPPLATPPQVVPTGVVAAPATTAPLPTPTPSTVIATSQPAVVSPTVVAAAPPATIAPTKSPAPTAAPTVAPTPGPEQREDAYFAAIRGLSPEITPIDRFYVVDEAVDDPRVDVRQWRLSIRGHVEMPYTLTYDELRALPAVEEHATLMCISYEPGQDLISNGTWRGVRLADLLKRAGVMPGATEVVLRSVDGFDESHPLAKAQEPTTLLAYGMNGQVLPVKHGAPLRAIIPGHYGYKHVKWLTEIEVITGTHQGYWERKDGWSQVGTLAGAMSRIDTVDAAPAKVGSTATVAGIAFASLRGISKVELSLDGGMHWEPARLKRILSPLSWRLWALEWKPVRTGRHRLLVRSYEADGRVQISERYPAHPYGATGLHEVEVEVVG